MAKLYQFSFGSIGFLFIRVKCRSGIRVLGAELVNTSAWHLLTDIGGRRHVAVVTANVRGDVAYSKKQR